MNNLKPIQTDLYGHRFRSRLEAKWAVFFETIREKSGGRFSWEYEPEGFELPNKQWYLPDFKCISPQGIVAWYEVKPETAGKSEKFIEFVNAIDPDRMSLVHWQQLNGSPYDFFNGLGTLCPRCGSLQSDGKTSILEDGLGYMCWPCDLDDQKDEDEPGIFIDANTHYHEGYVCFRNQQERSMFIQNLVVAEYSSAEGFETQLRKNRRWKAHQGKGIQ